MTKAARTKNRDRHAALAALVLGDAPAPPALAKWLASAEGRREVAAYRSVLAALDALYGRPRAAAPAETRAGRAGFRRAPARAVSRARVYYTAMPTPIGRVSLAASAHGLVRVSFGRPEAAFVAELRRQFGPEVERSPAKLRAVVGALGRYFSGARRTLDLPVDLLAATPFQRRVLMATRRVPAGRVVSYGDIARRIGQPRASRAVGQALGHNPIPIVIPCHRIVAGGGRLGGYTGGLRIKKKLLAIEGVRV